MGFNYGLERKRFNNEFENFSNTCLSAGMSNEDIEDIRQLDWSQFKDERNHRMHNQALDGSCFLEGDETDISQSPLLNKFMSQLSTPPEEIENWGRESWIDDLDTELLTIQIKKLSKEDIEFLTCLVLNGQSKADISRSKNISRAAVTKRIQRIKNKLEKSVLMVNKMTSPLTTI